MSEASSNTTEENDQFENLVIAAAGVVTGSRNIIGIRKAMEYVGFSEEQRKSMKLYQRVRRKAQKLTVVEVNKKQTTPPSGAELTIGLPNSEISSLTGESRSRNNTESGNVSDGSCSNEATSPISSVRDRLESVAASGGANDEKKAKATRRSSKDVQRHNAKDLAAKERDKKAMKAATILIKRQQDLDKKHPEKKSIDEIVKAMNKCYKSTITAKTAGWYVRKGLIGVSPLKKGPVGDFPKAIYNALKGAYSTYLKLEQAESKKQSGLKQMTKLVNKVVNAAGHQRTRDDLTKRLRRDTANEFEVGKANITEYRRVMWTTAYNLDVWFSTWKDLLIQLGFAREVNDGDENVEGELFFYEGQLQRILNVDETDGSIDDTTGQRGGRPPMTFLCPDIAGGATAANKSGYSSTIICGSNAAGEPVPPHFQLKTMAKIDENQRLSVDWFLTTKNIIAKFGHESRRAFPCTFGMNEKAGMNAVELDKYIQNSILPLYPDIEDTERKRVIMKVDSGPGRMNEEMLAHLRLKGFYLIPGVPNTTGKTQETDQNYGPFKSGFRNNIRQLSQARFEKGYSLNVTDLPMLVFGGVCPRTSIDLEDVFSTSFSVATNLSCWQKCGAIPLTRLPLQSKEVRREVAIGAAATLVADEEPDPELERIKSIDALNLFFCDLLTSHGYDGKVLQKTAPTRTTYVAVTQPHSLERVQAIKNAKTAGQLFFATGGRHINSDEFFKAKELKRREEELAKMEEKKKQRGLYCKDELGAVMLLKQKGELTTATE